MEFAECAEFEICVKISQYLSKVLFVTLKKEDLNKDQFVKNVHIFMTNEKLTYFNICFSV